MRLTDFQQKAAAKPDAAYLGAAFFLASIFALFLIFPAYAQNPLGIGGSERAIEPTGPFASILMWINTQQQDFMRSLTAALRAMRDEGTGTWAMVGLSFAYGVFHAAGPGHGKAIISSYMIANEVAARRGIYLSFVSAMLQAVVAIVIIGLLSLVLRGWGIRSGDVTSFLTTASYLGVTLLGAWLLWSKITGRGHSHCGGHHHEGSHSHNHDDGHMHAPDPKALSGTLSLRGAVSAVLAVGIRPCTGAIVVLTFAFLNGLYAAGIASTFAMAIGTGITVSALAILAVSAKDIALRLSRSQEQTQTIHRSIEILGALIVFLLGLSLLLAALFG